MLECLDTTIKDMWQSGNSESIRVKQTWDFLSLLFKLSYKGKIISRNIRKGLRGGVEVGQRCTLGFKVASSSRAHTKGHSHRSH